jgi:hypothetical protein
MKPITVRVAWQMDGCTFSILPTDQKMITDTLPTAFPASRIFVAYHIKSDFVPYFSRLETHILPALFGLENKEDLTKFEEILVWDSTHKKALHEIKRSYDVQEV